MISWCHHRPEWEVAHTTGAGNILKLLEELGRDVGSLKALEKPYPWS